MSFKYLAIVHGSAPHTLEKQELFHLNSLAFTSFIFINCPFQASAEGFVLCSGRLRRADSSSRVALRRRGAGVTDRIRDETGNLFSLSSSMARIRSLGKNNGLVFQRPFEDNLSLDRPSHDGYFPF